MSIALDEQLLSLKEAAERFPGHPSPVSIWRWYTRGIKGVKLATICVAGRRYTSVEAIDRFIAATTAAANQEPPPVRTPASRSRAIRLAEQELGLAHDPPVIGETAANATDS